MSRPSSNGRVPRCRIGGGRRRLHAGGPHQTAPVLERLELRQLLSLTPTQTPISTPTPTSAGDGPTVVSVQRFGFHAQPTILQLQFNQPLDPVAAQNPSNYMVRNFKSRPVNVAFAVYNPAADTVTLYPRQRIYFYHPAFLLVFGTAPTGLTNTAGVFLDGANTGRPGSSFSTQLRRNQLAGPAPAAAMQNATAVVDSALQSWHKAAKS